jgi:hypothetical protein
MKELTVEQVSVVSGGFKPPTQIWPGMSARLALTTFAGWGAVGGAFSAGWAIGSWLNANTRIQSHIAEYLQ